MGAVKALTTREKIWPGITEHLVDKGRSRRREEPTAHDRARRGRRPGPGRARGREARPQRDGGGERVDRREGLGHADGARQRQGERGGAALHHVGRLRRLDPGAEGDHEEGRGLERRGVHEGLQARARVPGEGRARGPPAAPMDLAGTLKGGLPSAGGLASEATGGLSDVRSVEDLADKLVKVIMRATSKRHLRLVGGALVELAGKTIVNAANKLYVEAVGGVKRHGHGDAHDPAQRREALLDDGRWRHPPQGERATSARRRRRAPSRSAARRWSEALRSWAHGKDRDRGVGGVSRSRPEGLGIELSTSGAKITGELKLKAGDQREGRRRAGQPDVRSAR